MKYCKNFKYLHWRGETNIEADLTLIKTKEKKREKCLLLNAKEKRKKKSEVVCNLFNETHLVNEFSNML